MRKALLSQRSALADIAIPGRHGAGGDAVGVDITVRDDFALALIVARRDRAEQVMATIAESHGVALVDGLRRVSANGVSFLGLGCGQWLALALPFNEDFADGLAHGLADCASVTDQSDSRFVLDIKGPKARDMLTKGVALDLDARVFPSGHCAQTLVAHMAVGIACIDAAVPHFEVTAARSTAESFWHWLTHSAGEYGTMVRT
jgi:sarcosine oxidase subunit gamma